MNKKPSLLVVGAAWPMETFIERLLRGLARKGFRITLACENRPPHAWLRETGIQWLPAPLWRGRKVASFVRLFIHSLRVLLAAPRDGSLLGHSAAERKTWRDRVAYWYSLLPFAGRRWNVIYFPWNLTAVSYLPLFDFGMPVVISCRGSQIYVAPHNPCRPEVRPGLRETFYRAAAVHCVSRDILREAQAWGLDPAKAQVIPPAVDVDFFCPPESPRMPDGRFYVITVGSLVWIKGLEYALTAVKKVREVGVPITFEIIGEGAERTRLLFTIEDLGLQDCVRLAGRLPPEQVRSHLQQADAFLLSSLSEGISNAALEAMACGLPVVTTDGGGMREAVTDGVEGFVVPVRDSQAMADKLILLAENPTLRTQIGHAARQRVIQDFRLESQIRSFEALFDRVTSRG